jgi:transcriptional regulator with XRE-family HTH domain
MEVSDTKLRRLRRERAWSIRELAQMAGVSTETIYAWSMAGERGRGRAWSASWRKLWVLSLKG